MLPPLDKAARDSLLALRLRALHKHRSAIGAAVAAKPESRARATALLDAEVALSTAASAEADYYDRLPVRAFSLCPVCSTPLLRNIDPFGLDGLWWQFDARPIDPDPCPHLCCLRGAVALGDSPPALSVGAVLPGPEVPYVIPRLLEHDGMTAVVSQLALDSGERVFTVGYFAERRPPPEQLAPDWPRSSYVYKTAFGQVGWRLSVDAWDFDLEPWLAAGKLRWCPPEVDPPTFGSGPASGCPYVDLKGRREPALVRGGMLTLEPLPDGLHHWPFSA